MAEIGNLVNLQDISRMLDPKGDIAQVIDVLARGNEILDDIVWEEGNLPTGHQSTILTGYPEPSWRLLNYGVAQAKGQTRQITDTCGLLESYLETDVKVLKLNNYKQGFVRNQVEMFIKGFGTKLAYTLFYGNTSVTPEGFMGLLPRYNTLSTDQDEVGYNIIDAKGTGSDNTSIYLVVWSPATTFGIYPKGSKAGMEWKDLGEDTKIDSNGLMHQVNRINFSWDCGLTVANWRSVSRIANIDVSDLRTAGDSTDTSTNLLKYMNMAIDKVEETIPGGRAAFYMHPDVKSLLRFKMEDKGFAQLSMKDIMGRQNVMTFNGIPLRSCRSLLLNESRVV